MKRVIMLIAILLVGITLSACNTERGYADCSSPDGTQACWNAEDENFRWEEGAEITLGVDNDNMGNALVAKWDADFPALAGKLVYRNYGSVNGNASGVQGIQDGQGEAPDVALVIDNEVTGKEGSLLPLHEYFEDLGKAVTNRVVFDTINKSGTYLLSSVYDGLGFAWNKTMIEALGISTVDSNNDNLPDAFDTWEEIFAIAATYTSARPTYSFTKKDNTVVNKTILEFFPISLDEPWSGYASLTAGGWKLFSQNKMDDPEFNDPKFKAGLEFIQAFAATNMSVDETGNKKAAASMGWRWEAFLDGEYPFSLVGTWMSVDSKEDENGLDFKFSQMPTYKGVQLAPLIKTKGFVINAFTEAPSAASEVLRWLYTKDVYQIMIDSSSYLTSLQDNANIYPTITSENQIEFIAAVRFNHLEPGAALPLASTVRAMNVYYNIGITDFLKAVWAGEKTPTQAQTEIVSAAQAWLALNNVAA